jgi:hypothetical protein
VEARFGGDQPTAGPDGEWLWYAGTVDVANEDGTFAVHYDDGDYEEAVHPELIRVSGGELFRPFSKYARR